MMQDFQLPLLIFCEHNMSKETTALPKPAPTQVINKTRQQPQLIQQPVWRRDGTLIIVTIQMECRMQKAVGVVV